MNVQINIGNESNAAELTAAAAFFTQLAATRNDSVRSTGAVAPIVLLGDTSHALPELTGTVAISTATEGAAAATSGGATETAGTVKRTRRTKAEIQAEADAAAAAAVEPVKGADGNTNPAADPETPQPDAGATASPPADAPVDKATGEIGSTGKKHTEGSVQAMASTIARTKGPQVIKDKIAELGADRIGTLTPENLQAMGNYLETLL